MAFDPKAIAVNWARSDEKRKRQEEERQAEYWARRPADHQPPRARFERTHDRGIIGRRQPHEVIHSISLRRHGGQLDLLHANSRVLEIEPERIELAVLAHNLDQLGTEKLAYGENPDNLTFGKQLLDARHPLLPSA